MSHHIHPYLHIHITFIHSSIHSNLFLNLTIMKKSTKQKIKLLLQDNDSISFGNALRNLFLSFSASKLTYTCLYSPSNSQPPFSLEIIKSILQNFFVGFCCCCHCCCCCCSNCFTIYCPGSMIILYVRVKWCNSDHQM